jgi:hypothetical protein
VSKKCTVNIMNIDTKIEKNYTAEFSINLQKMNDETFFSHDDNYNNVNINYKFYSDVLTNLEKMFGVNFLSSHSSKKTEYHDVVIIQQMTLSKNNNDIVSYNVSFGQKNCLKICVEDDKNNKGKKMINVDKIDKCKNVKNIGQFIVKLMTKLCDNLCTNMKLYDESNLHFGTSRGYKKVSLYKLKILSNGQSWYNSYGIVSKNFEEEQKNNLYYIKNMEIRNIVSEKYYNDKVFRDNLHNVFEIVKDTSMDSNISTFFKNVSSFILDKCDKYSEEENIMFCEKSAIIPFLCDLVDYFFDESNLFKYDNLLYYNGIEKSEHCKKYTIVNLSATK